jgi:hypothetical protein
MVGARQLFVALSIPIACVPALIGCGSSDGPRTAVGLTVLPVSEKDFKISAPKSVRPGDIRLVVRHPGPDDHELIIVRAPASGRLPMRADGMTVDEDALEPTTAVAIEPALPGSTSNMRVNLTPGRYVMFCNMSGHYRGGMHRTLVVR